MPIDIVFLMFQNAFSIINVTYISGVPFFFFLNFKWVAFNTFQLLWTGFFLSFLLFFQNAGYTCESHHRIQQKLKLIPSLRFFLFADLAHAKGIRQKLGFFDRLISFLLLEKRKFFFKID